MLISSISIMCTVPGGNCPPFPAKPVKPPIVGPVTPDTPVIMKEE